MRQSAAREGVEPVRERQATRPGTLERLRGRIGALAEDLPAPLVVFVVHAAVVFAAAAAGVRWLASRPVITPPNYDPPEMTGLARYLVAPLGNWDGYWYALIAEQGYGVHPATAAFWPLYARLLRWGAELTGLGTLVVGVLISNAAFLVALVFLHRLVRLDYGRPVAGRTVWLLGLFPTAFYFSAVYTESVFLLFTVAAIYFGRTERWALAGLAGAAAAFTRSNGALVLLALAIMAARRYGWNPLGWWRVAARLAIIPLAPLPFLWHMQRTWGDWLLPVRIQSYEDWQRYRAMPWETLVAAARELNFGWAKEFALDPTLSNLVSTDLRLSFQYSKTPDILVALGFLPLAVYMLRRVRPAYSLYALAAFVVPLFSPSHYNPVMSYSRFVIVLFPFFVALALLLRRRWLVGALLALSTVALAGLTIQFATWFFVA